MARPVMRFRKIIFSNKWGKFNVQIKKKLRRPITGDWEDMAAIRMESVDRVPLAFNMLLRGKRIQAIIFRKSFMIRKNGRTVNLNLQKNIPGYNFRSNIAYAPNLGCFRLPTLSYTEERSALTHYNSLWNRTGWRKMNINSLRPC